jgi:hypothetical protein
MITVRAVTAFALLLLTQGGCGSSTPSDTSTGPQNGGGAIGTSSSTGTTTAVKLVINELQPANKDTLTDEKGDADDWIEIYNPGDVTVDLKGYVVGDSSNKQVIPGTLPVPAGGYVLLWADDSPSQGNAHLGFKLSASAGDAVTLTDPAGKIIDTITFGVATDQNVYARFPSGTGSFAWCDKPTPGAGNGSACGTP